MLDSSFFGGATKPHCKEKQSANRQKEENQRKCRLIACYPIVAERLHQSKFLNIINDGLVVDCYAYYRHSIFFCQSWNSFKECPFLRLCSHLPEMGLVSF